LPALARNSEIMVMGIELKINEKMRLETSFPKSLCSIHLEHGRGYSDHFCGRRSTTTNLWSCNFGKQLWENDKEN